MSFGVESIRFDTAPCGVGDIYQPKYQPVSLMVWLGRSLGHNHRYVQEFEVALLANCTYGLITQPWEP